MKRLLCIFLLSLASIAQAVEARFDSLYLFQPEAELKQKQVDFEDMARFSRQMQAKVWKALKKVKMPDSNGYLVLAVHSDGQIAAWLDMQPALHEYYDNEVVQAVRTVAPFFVAQGTVVFAIKMAVDTPKFMRNRIRQTPRGQPDPPAWQDARKKVAHPDNIEELVQAAWPE
jgi:hypothetical protein